MPVVKGKGRRPVGVETRRYRLTTTVTARDLEDVSRIASAWDVSLAMAAYYLLVGRLCELREERPGVEVVELVSQWLAEQGRKVGHHGKHAASTAQAREARARGEAGGGAED